VSARAVSPSTARIECGIQGLAIKTSFDHKKFVLQRLVEKIFLFCMFLRFCFASAMSH